MTGRDRMVLIGVVVLVFAAAGWMLVVSPERKKAGTVASEVTAARSALSTARTELTNAQAAEHKYSSAYSAIVSLGKAVPATAEVPALIYQISQASHDGNVEFNSIATAGATSASTAAATTAAAGAGFSALPFTFIFDGDFFSLEHMFRSLTAFTNNTPGGVQVSGRLLTISSVKLSVENTGTGTAGKGSPKLAGSITADAYVLPAGQSLTAGATAASPTATTTSTAATSATTPAPAVVKVTP